MEKNTYLALVTLSVHFLCPKDCSRASTKSCDKNGFNPLWDEKFTFGMIHEPELAVIRFIVYNKTEFLCQSTLPLNCLRQGNQT